MSTEEKIKQAFERQAGRAGDHRKVLAEVRRVTSKRRVGGVGISLITIGVAAAVVTPVLLFSGEQPTGTGPANTVETTLPEPAIPRKPAEHAGEGVAVLTYQPSWLPDGAYEFDRESRPDGTLARTWRIPDSPSGEQFLVRIAADNQPMVPDRAGTVDINGIPGTAEISGQHALVTWMAEPGQRLSIEVNAPSDVRDTALRIARSVKPDGDAAFEQPLSFDWLPQHIQPGGWRVQGSRPNDLDVSADTTGGPRDRVVAAIRADKPNGGTPVTVRGKQGVAVRAADTSLFVCVELEPGRWLQVGGSFPQKDLVKVADTIRIGPLSYPWLGTR